MRGAAVAVVATLLLSVAAACSSDGPAPGRPASPAAPRVLTAPRGERTSGTLDVASGFHSVAVRAADLGASLFRAATPATSSALPTATVDRGHVLIGERGAASGGGPAYLDVAISTSVRWTLRFTGGASSLRLALSAGRIRAVDLVSGFALINLTLPKPDGSLRVTMAGGSTDFAVHLVDAAPARVRVAGGAGTVILDGARRTGVAGGTTLAPPTWATAANRYDIDCTAGVSTLSVVHR
jgi:hypothetical protein